MRTHTTTQQWQSFEIRMRHRRAERCRLRAEIAIEAGCADVAREALEEARELEPALPGLILIEERLSSVTPMPEQGPPMPQQVPPAEGQSLMGRWGLVAAACFTLAAGFAGWLVPGEPAAPPAVITAASSRIPAQARPATGITDAHPPAVAAGVSARATVADASDEAPGTTSGTAAAGEQPAAPSSTSAPLVTAAPVFDAPPPESHPPARNADALPGTAIPVPAAPLAAAPSADLPPLAAPASSLPEVTAEPARNPAVRPVPATDPTAAQSEPGAEVKVRSALSRYEAAYSTLNASAARAVWPSVDANALGRAFDSLQSQQISLRDCSVAVTGQTARANCTGSATWTPKVGGGARTEPRRWTFDLEQAGGQWEIVRATAR